jgi:hypothetical protein
LILVFISGEKEYEDVINYIYPNGIPSTSALPKPGAALPKPASTPLEFVIQPTTLTGTLSELLADDKIKAEVKGESIQRTSVTITNTGSQPADVEINIGTWFESKSSGIQNMLVIAPRTVTVEASGSATVSVPTACMNASRDIPTNLASFNVKYDEKSRLTRLAEYINENGISYDIAQAAIWMVTDNLLDWQMIDLLVYEDGEPVYSQDDVYEAREILRQVP